VQTFRKRRAGLSATAGLSCSISLAADATDSLFSVKAIDDVCRDKVDDDVIRNVECIIELVMIRDNMLQLSSEVFSLMDIRDVISYLCTG